MTATLTPRLYHTKHHGSFKLRRNTPQDAPGIVAAINTVCSEGLWLMTPHYVPTTQWKRVLHQPAKYPNYLLLVIEPVSKPGKIVGWCRIFPYEFGDKSRHVADLGMGLVKEFREVGLGRALLEYAIDYIRNRPFKKLTLSVFSNNRGALKLFKKLKFKEIGRRKRQVKIKGRYYDEILMERFL